MKEIDYDRAAKILSGGGNIYMHPDDVTDLHIQAQNKNNRLCLDKIIVSTMVLKGTVFAAKTPNLLLHGE